MPCSNFFKRRQGRPVTSAEFRFGEASPTVRALHIGRSPHPKLLARDGRPKAADRGEANYGGKPVSRLKHGERVPELNCEARRAHSA